MEVSSATTICHGAETDHLPLKVRFKHQDLSITTSNTDADKPLNIVKQVKLKPDLSALEVELLSNKLEIMAVDLLSS